MLDKDSKVWPAVLALAGALVLFPPTITAEEASKGANDGWRFWWKDSFRLESPDGELELRFGGRLHLDASFPDADAEIEDAFGPLADSNQARRGRLYVRGTLYENVEFKAQYEFATGEVQVKDLYLGLKKTPIGAVRVGHFKEPFSLEELTSANYITFLERATNNVFAPSRNVGVMLHDHRGDRLTWAVGAFRESDNLAASEGDGKLNLTGRVTGLPIYQDEGRRLLHLGLSLSRKDLGDELFRFRQRPEAHQAPRFVDTGSFAADKVDLFAVELAVVSGRFWAMSEYIGARADAPQLGDPAFGGWYVESGWFLTRGDYRPYKTSGGSFDRERPNRVFGKDGGRGAWEIAVRYSTLDLTDGAIDGGRMDDVSVALNWYLNSASRVMLDYVTSDVDGVGDAGFFLVRFQVNF